MFIIPVSAAQAVATFTSNKRDQTLSSNDYSIAFTIAIDFSLQSDVQVVTFAPMKETQLFESLQLVGQVGGNNSYLEELKKLLFRR